MPQGKGTYGTKKGRPPKKKKQQMPDHVGLQQKRIRHYERLAEEMKKAGM